EPEIEVDGGSFWIEVTDRKTSIQCVFSVAKSLGPRIHSIGSESYGTYSINLSSPARFLQGRVLLPWLELQRHPGASLESAGLWSATAGNGQALNVEADREGLIVSSLCFGPEPDGTLFHIDIRLRTTGATAETLPPDVEAETLSPSLRISPSEIAAVEKVPGANSRSIRI
ncbi:MAG TPA: hypothetical protein VI756_24870, partial [Blastocatellia bacterium]